MTYIRICALYSGSGGNAVLIETEKTRILIDAGKSARTLCRALSSVGVDMADVDAIFITHEHTDHVSALEVLTKKHRIPIHVTAPSAGRFDGRGCPCLCDCLVRHEPYYTAEVGDLRIRSFRTPHDARMSVGYRIETESGEAIGYATDVGYVTQEIADALVGCEAVVLESNHDPEMLQNGPYPYDLKKRIRSNRGHLSNPDSAAFAAGLAQMGTRAFLLAHLSEENNEPSLALEECERAISDPRIRIEVAAQDHPVELIWGKEQAYDWCEAYNPWNA